MVETGMARSVPITGIRDGRPIPLSRNRLRSARCACSVRVTKCPIGYWVDRSSAETTPGRPSEVPLLLVSG
jgi:hypothetical protein